MTISLSALRAFEAAARLGGFGRAAAELGISAGAISQHVKVLEFMAGEALFCRHGRGVILSELGASVYGHAQRAVAEADQAEAVLVYGRLYQAMGETCEVGVRSASSPVADRGSLSR